MVGIRSAARSGHFEMDADADGVLDLAAACAPGEVDPERADYGDLDPDHSRRRRVCCGTTIHNGRVARRPAAVDWCTSAADVDLVNRRPAEVGPPSG